MSGSRRALALVIALAGATVVAAPASAATPPIPLHTWFTNDPLAAPAAPTAGGAPVTVMMCAQQTGGLEVILAVEFDITAVDPSGHSAPDDPALARQNLQSWIPGAAVQLGGLGLDGGSHCFRIRLTFGANAPAGRWQLRTHLAAYGLSVGGIIQPILPLSEQDDPFSLTVSVTLQRPAPQPPAPSATRPAAAPATNPTTAPGGPAAASGAVALGPAGSGAGASGAASIAVPVQLADATPAGTAGRSDDEHSSPWWILGVAFAAVCLGGAAAVLRGRRRT